MSLYDLIQRTDLILKKYEKYDTPMAKKENKAGDPFGDDVSELETQIEYLFQRADEISREKNRAVIATTNAEIRKLKDTMLKVDLENLRKKIKRGKTTKDIIRQRQEIIQQLAEKISNIPDGGGVRRPFNKLGVPGIGPGKHGTAIELTPLQSEHLANNPLYYQHTDETQRFEQEAQQAFKKQDAHIDRIERGIDELGQLAKGMNEELDKQNPIISDINHQMDRVVVDIKKNNAKLKGVLDKMRSSRNFFCDVLLIALLLGIGAYIYSMLK